MPRGEINLHVISFLISSRDRILDIRQSDNRTSTVQNELGRNIMEVPDITASPKLAYQDKSHCAKALIFC